MSEETSVLPGMSVCTFDGRRLGRVAAAEPGRLLVERRWRGAYWMRRRRGSTWSLASIGTGRRFAPGRTRLARNCTARTP